MGETASDRQKHHALGRSRGGFSTKIHAVVEALGNPVGFKLSGGEETDCSWAIPALTDFEFGKLLGEKGYDRNEIWDFLQQRGATACIPPKSNRKEQREYDTHLYKEHNLVSTSSTSSGDWPHATKKRLVTSWQCSI